MRVQTEAAEAGVDVQWVGPSGVQSFSSYEPALSESHSSPLGLLLVWSLKVACAVPWAAYLEGSMAKMEYDTAFSPL